MASDRRAFMLRVDPELLAAVQRWAEDDLRSLNGQIEFLLRRALDAADRTPRSSRAGRTEHTGRAARVRDRDG